MPQRIHPARAGFTLVEFGIAVAIIALLAAVAVPGYFRARKRSQALVILGDALAIDGAIDQYALENKRKAGEAVNGAMMKEYFDPKSRLYRLANTGAALTDILGNNYSYGSFEGGVKVNPATEKNFADVLENPASFWGSYY